MQTKQCSRCKQHKPLTDFYRCKSRTDGRQNCCKTCNREQQREWRAQNLEHLRQRRREYNARNVDACVRWKRTTDLRKYGLTSEDYDGLLAYQDGLCAICQNVCSTGRRLAVDHDHASGRVRGLLCSNCNRGLGYLGDSVERLQAAIEYLEREVRWKTETSPTTSRPV